MTAAAGSCELAAGMAARALLERGCSALAAKIGAHVASFGGACWQTYERIRAVIRRRDGQPYHVESIGRAWRGLVRAGVMASQRIMPGQRPPGARHASAHGTTDKRVLWRALGLRDPTTPRDHARAAAAQRDAEEAAREAAHGRPRHSAPVPAAPPPAPPPELAELIARVGDLIDQRETRRESAHDAAVIAALELERGPPPSRGS